jgi:hypothetical protein
LSCIRDFECDAISIFRTDAVGRLSTVAVVTADPFEDRVTIASIEVTVDKEKSWVFEQFGVAAMIALIIEVVEHYTLRSSQLLLDALCTI